MNVFTIDGVPYNVAVTKFERTFAVTDTDKAGRSINGNMIRDIIGTFYNYSMSIDSRNVSQGEYNSLYQILSAPVDSHNFVFPYNGETISFKGYVTNGKDTLKTMKEGKNKWTGLEINIISMEPQRRP